MWHVFVGSDHTLVQRRLEARVIAGWNIPPTSGRQLLRALSDFAKVGLKTSRALDVKALQALRYDEAQAITLYNSKFNDRRQRISDYSPPLHAQRLLKLGRTYQRGIRPFDDPMARVGAYATAAHDMLNRHSTKEFRLAGNGQTATSCCSDRESLSRS